MIPTPKGPHEINVRGLRAASLLGRYWAAVDDYYERGDTSVKKFQGEIDYCGRRHKVFVIDRPLMF